MKFLCVLLFASFLPLSHAQDAPIDIGVRDSKTGIVSAAEDSLFKKASADYTEGKYQSVIDELKMVEVRLLGKATKDSNKLGLVYYWLGVCYSRIQEFPLAIKSFDDALKVNYSPLDLNYEYGQALFAADKLSEARIQFRESLKKKFKRGVSLYYIAFISKELNEKKKAVTFFKAIEKLDAEEAAEVRQAAEFQIADIYLEQVEKHPDAFSAVENYVIPQYQKALEVDKNSSLAPQIKEKIVGLQKKYDLILFKLRNGRPTIIPPYFLRAALEAGVDSNVIFAPTENQVSESERQSPFVKSDFLGRYTFYIRDYMSVAPEFRFNYTRYLNRKPEIYRNDNYLLAPALRTAFEHRLWKKPASVLLDYDYNEARRDINSEEKLDFSSRSHSVMLGERFNYFNAGESIIRIRKRYFESFDSSQDSESSSLSFEQIQSLGANTMLYMVDYTATRVETDVFDTNSMTFRADLIMGRVKDWFTPSFGLGLTLSDPINDSVRGTEVKWNPSLRLVKTFKDNIRGTFRAEYDQNDSKDKENFAYKKYVTAFELEYLF